MIDLHSIAVVLFFAIAALLIQTYIGTYLSLLLFIRNRQHKVPELPDNELPTMTILIPAYNEEELINERIKNILEQDYPLDRLGVLVVSDRSTDSTEAISLRYVDRGVRTVTMRERSGKLGILDGLAPQMDGDVLVITDANVSFHSQALRRMGEHYADPQVGAVAGNLRLKPPPESKNVEWETAYRRFEIALKQLMGCAGIVIGIYGGFYSFRRHLFRPIVRNNRPCHDDVILPLEIMIQGYRVTFAEQAYATENTTPTIHGEYIRRVRMAAYNLNSIPRTLSLSLRAGLNVAYVAFFYKILRWLSPHLLGLFYFLSLMLSMTNLLFAVTASVITAGMLLALMGYIWDRRGAKAGIATAAYHFAIINLASFVGLVGWLRGAKRYWTPRAK